jgi:hypothetical protein
MTKSTKTEDDLVMYRYQKIVQNPLQKFLTAIRNMTFTVSYFEV